MTHMKRTILLSVGLLCSILLVANPISRNQAQQKAIEFLTTRGKQHTPTKMVSRKARKASGEESAYYYIFNVGNHNGYVIVSGDDRTDAILGYADDGEIDADNIPDNMRAWLEEYATQIQWMEEHNTSSSASALQAQATSPFAPLQALTYPGTDSRRTPAKASTLKRAISPLTTSKWNQSEPYNLLCPSYNDELTVTGCVATATAQLMYYHRNNSTQTTLAQIPGYTTYSLDLNINPIDITPLDWEHMQDTYTSSNDLNDPANKAVATLMQCIGAAVKMDYNVASTGGSSAITADVPQALITYFGYDQDALFINRNDYTYSEWVNIIYKELSNGPVLYSGQSAGGGHAFLCDGYAEDDYFHINWGWGGSSDGYFKLAVLNPDNQGIGGSSTTDGYSFLQGAMVNVKPQDDGISQRDTRVRMTTSAFYVNESSVTRTSINENFEAITTLHTFRNLTGNTYTFDLGIALYQDGTLLSIIDHDERGVELANAYGWVDYEWSLSFGAGLGNGIYRIVPVSRQHGTDTYLPNADTEQHYIQATISGNTMFFSTAETCKLNATMHTEGETVVGSPVNIVANISCMSGTYSGDIILYQLYDGYNAVGRYGGQLVELSAGESKNFTFSFTPQYTGDYVFVLADKNDNFITSPFTITVLDNNTTTGNLAVNINNIKLTNGSFADGVYGSKVQGTAAVTNSASADHTSGILACLLEGRDDGYYYGTNIVQTYNQTVPANGTTTLNFELDGMIAGKRYLLAFYSNLNAPQRIGLSYSFLSRYGVTTYKADGTSTTTAPTANVVVDEQATALDISHVDGILTVTPNSNPNTLYFINTSNALPAGLEGKNIVANGVATTLTLTDGYDFRSPATFVANSITYTRLFTQGAQGNSGWSTLLLPFDAESVTQDDKELSWFRADNDKNKNFWLKEFVDEENGTVYFDYANRIKANTPYLIAVPGDKWGAAWNLTNKDITFTTTHATVKASPTQASISGDSYKFTGNTYKQPLNNVYILNDAGNSFEKSSATLPAFRAYFTSTEYANHKQLSIGSRPHTTDIKSVSENNATQTDATTLYNLQGQPVSTPTRGIYIQNGKKIYIK